MVDDDGDVRAQQHIKMRHQGRDRHDHLDMPIHHSRNLYASGEFAVETALLGTARVAASPAAQVVPQGREVFRGAAPAAAPACSMADAAVSKSFICLRRPCQASRSATERTSESGLAMFLPAMSGAEPCAA